jgi:ATPase subunit of ABC transporter with duplicated ATPase domains
VAIDRPVDEVFAFFIRQPEQPSKRTQDAAVAGDDTLRITRARLESWRNFQLADVELQRRVFLVGPNASGKSNFLDALRFQQDISSLEGASRRLD